MKSELLTTAYLSLKRIRQNDLAANMTSKGDSSKALVEQQQDIQVTLAATFHDHISCTKSPDMCQPVQKEEKAHMPCETDHIYANCNRGSNDNKSAVTGEESQQRLKDMVLLQLDLIQHQQEQLAKRDRQLQTLRQEKEALKVRLERMERRVSLLKQRKELVAKPEHVEGNQTSLTCGSFAGDTFKTGSKESKHVLKAAYRRLHGSTAQLNPDSLEGPTLDHPWTTPLILPKSEGVLCVDVKNVVSGRVRTAGTQKTAAVNRSPKSRSKGDQDGMQTHHLYPLPLSYIAPEPEIARVESSNIEVPRWKYQPVTSCYHMEGTENLDDEIFLRRHHKLEIDEKRRKRWDLQRLREQRHNEKLRQGRTHGSSYGRGNNQSYLNSFFPQSTDAQFVEVSDTVPVVAFGSAIPHIPSSTFSLDWLPGFRLGQREDQGGGCRKGSRSNSVGSSTAASSPRKEN